MARARRRAPTTLRGLLHPAYGPLVRVELCSSTGESITGLAVIDTGASMSAIDKGAAAELSLPSFGAASWFAVTGGDRPMAPLRRAQVRLGEGTIFWELDLLEVDGQPPMRVSARDERRCESPIARFTKAQPMRVQAHQQAQLVASHVIRLPDKGATAISAPHVQQALRS